MPDTSRFAPVDLLLKFGGSIATDPDTSDRVNATRVRALAEIIRDRADSGVVVVHGTGHVGKPAAIQHGFHRTGRLEANRRDIALGIKNDLADLNTRITGHLLDIGVPALAMHAEDALPVEPNYTRTADIVRLRDALRAGLVPVLYGDMIRTENDGWRVLSSDEILVHLAKLLRPRLTAFLSDVDGVLGIDPRSGEECLIETLTPEDDDQVSRRSSDVLDVSGGMTAKINTARDAAQHSGSCHILNGAVPARLREIIDGAPTVSTRVTPLMKGRQDQTEVGSKDPSP